MKEGSFVSERYLSEISQTKGKHLSVIIDDMEFLLYPSELKKLGLKANTMVDEALYCEMFDMLSKRALLYAAHLLKARDYSIKLLKDKLLYKKYPKETVAYVIEYLLDKKYLDDERYARNYCLSKQGLYGGGRLKNELYQRGIDAGIIDKVLAEVFESYDSYSLIERYAKQKGFDKEHYDQKQRDRFCRFLIRKGIDYNDIADFLA